MTLMATLFIQARAPTCHSSFFSTRNLDGRICRDSGGHAPESEKRFGPVWSETCPLASTLRAILTRERLIRRNL
ncbi:unnamed protein product [Arabidopsis thaliana]|uniref:(thale cress) hypothetical protein n=1 Tax=Arabidopsis thaliana TaxID=3702 RepID=A0A7G2EGJ8_ARATH|nr:unnamed protein product [Arabidopsis thaliana]